MGPHCQALALVNIYGEPAVDVRDGWYISAVQIFTSIAHRLFFITGKSAELTVVTMLKKMFCSCKLALSVLLHSLYLFMEINRRHYFGMTYMHKLSLK